MTSSDNTGYWRQNQCLYLSLAAATTPPRESIHHNATCLRETIEAAVRASRPNWAHEDFLGEEVGAFADFLIWGLQAAAALRGRTVAIYDARTGSCEIIRPQTSLNARAPVIALWFSGAHYRWVRWAPPGPRLAQLLARHQSGPAGAPRVITVTINAAG
jgi:hypothetical protein